MEDSINILKVRDDNIPLCFLSDENSKMRFTSGTPAWLSEPELTLSALRERIEPWLTSLFQSEHLSLLVGSGLSTAIQYIATDTPPDNGMGKPDLKNCPFADKIELYATKSANKNGRGNANIEDYFRVINDLLQGLIILGKNKDYKRLIKFYNNLLQDFILKISAGERCIVEATDERKAKAINILVTFLMSFASRTGTRDRLNIFTTNYDRIIEMGAELAGLYLIDRFVGNLFPIFRSSRLDIDMHYNPPGIRGEPRYLEGVARYTKLHGSIDWIESGNNIYRIGMPFGITNIKPYLNAPGFTNVDNTKVMIYPNSSKDRETAEYPYVELFRDFAAALCRPNTTLVTYGYSFGDEHINRIIRDMLTIPSTHLVIISLDDKSNRIMRNYEEIGRNSQISLLIGPILADIEKLTENFLPKASIDRTTIRMAELLRQRSITKSVEIANKGVGSEGGGLE